MQLENLPNIKANPWDVPTAIKLDTAWEQKKIIF